MKNKKIEELYNKIEMLESRRIEYLEVNNKSNARRIQKQIEQIEQKIQVSEYDNLKQELSIYKEIINNYPSLQLQIKNKLLDLKKEI